MTRQRPTMVQLPEDLVARADRRAARRGVSRSQVIRDALVAHLAEEEQQSIARTYEEAYGRQPFGVEDEWGDLEAFHDALARERAPRSRPRRRRGS